MRKRTIGADLIPEQWRGLWRSVGYNRILEIGASGYAIYTATASGATLFEQGSAGQFFQAFDRLEITDRGRLALFHANDLTRYEFERCEGFPPGCQLFDTTSADAQLNFRAFCELFAENYAFFDLRGVDWRSQCDAAEARLDASPSPAALLDVFEEMIAPLDDLHVYVAAPGRKVRSARNARGPRQALQDLFKLDTPMLSARSTTDRIAAGLREVLLADFAGTLADFRQAGNGIVAWGTLRPRIGYLNLLRMFGFAASDAARAADDIPRRLFEAGPFMAADMRSLEQILDVAFADLAHHDALVIDVRLNGGGFDRAGMLVCEHLTDTSRTVYRKMARCAEGFTEPQAITISPSRGARYTKPVYLLTSPLTLSAGEVFALAMSSLPSVTVLGEPTQGILSDNLFHRLPCDWEVSLSNEVYLGVDGQCYEGAGVPPDRSLPALGANNLLDDLRAGLCLAVQQASAS
jgi:carboxyl-terminal processing protease